MKCVLKVNYYILEAGEKVQRTTELTLNWKALGLISGAACPWALPDMAWTNKQYVLKNTIVSIRYKCLCLLSYNFNLSQKQKAWVITHMWNSGFIF